MIMKECTRCKIEKSLLDFGKRKTGKNGLQSICKVCMNAQTIAWQKENLDVRDRNAKKWRKENTEKKKVSDKKGRQKWERNNRGTVNAKTARRRATKLQATPKWLNNLHKAHMQIFYEAAAELTKELNIPFHVDHIVPLQAENMCGLHVPWNLQVIPASENCSKGNKVIFTEIERQNAIK